MEFSKLQIRAKVLSVITQIKSLRYRNEEELQNLIGQLDEISDKKALFDIFIKEYIKLEENDYLFCACLLKELVSADYITEKSLDMIKSKSLSDEYKYKIVQLLRISGGKYNYNELPEYFDNPQEVMDLETKRLLDSAVFNPESMLDFLDFVSAVSEKDKSLLLKSLAIDYTGDVLANIVYPVLYSDFSEDFILQAIDVLCESKSSLAIAPLEYLIETSESERIVNTCKIGLKKLKLAGAKREKADEYFKNIIKSSTPSYQFVTIPDGSGKQAVLSARKHFDDNFSIAAFVISDVSGIVDCFGFFNISQEEVIRIIKKFYNSEGQYEINCEYVKSRVDDAVKLNMAHKNPFPYEFICWYPMINDFSSLNCSIKDYVCENCKTQPLSKQEVINLISEEYTFRWFIMPQDNHFMYNLIDKIYDSENLEILKLNSYLKDNINNIFHTEFEKIWIDRLYNLVYILLQNKKTEEAEKFYTILKDENFFTLLKEIILQKSIFNYFFAQRENKRDSILTANIFRKRNSESSRYEEKKLDLIIDTLKRGWLGFT